MVGINAIERKIDNMLNLHVIEPLMVKEQILVTATESIILLMRVDDVVMKKPVDTHGHTHTHLDSTHIIIREEINLMIISID